MRVVVVGGGIAGLAAARRLEGLVPEAELTLVERTQRLGGKLLTEHVDGFLIEAAPDSFLARKERGVGLCRELGLSDELVGRRPENARSFVRHGSALRPLPEGLTGLVPTDLDALAGSSLLTLEGMARLGREPTLAPAPPGEDESIASFVSRRLGREAYERLVEPLVTGIYGGDGEQLSLEATFPNLRQLELEHGSVLRGLAAQPLAENAVPPFLSLREGMETLVTAIVSSLQRTTVLTGRAAAALQRGSEGWEVELDGAPLDAEGVVLATPAFVSAELLRELDAPLAAAHAGIPYASSAIVTLAYDAGELPSLEGYGYVVPSAEGCDVLACTWSSSKWEGRAPRDSALVRVYLGRFGGRDVTTMADEELVEVARDELRVLAIHVEPRLRRVHRWPQGMPQYVLGHPERLAAIEAALERHPGLALAGAAYRGVGIPDCIASGEAAAQSIAHSLRRTQSREASKAK